MTAGRRHPPPPWAAPLIAFVAIVPLGIPFVGYGINGVASAGPG